MDLPLGNVDGLLLPNAAVCYHSLWPVTTGTITLQDDYLRLIDSVFFFQSWGYCIYLIMAFFSFFFLGQISVYTKMNRVTLLVSLELK